MGKPQTLKQAVEANEGLLLLVKRDEEVAKNDKNGKGFLPYKTQLQIATRLRKLDADAKHFESEKMILAKKYGEPIHEAQTPEQIKDGAEKRITGYAVSPKSATFAEFDAAFKTLLESEATSEPIFPLSVDSLGENPPLSMSLIVSLQAVGVLAQEEDKETK